MYRSQISRYSRWCYIFVAVVSLWVTASTIFAIYYGLNSDRDNIPELLTQVLPAGHCTCQTSTNFVCESCFDCQSSPLVFSDNVTTWEFEYPRDGNDLSFNETQCSSAFPGLFEDVSRATRYWQDRQPYFLPLLEKVSIQNGMTRAAIHKGKLYIISTKSRGEDHRRKTLAILSSIYQSLSADSQSSKIPDFEFVFSVEDKITDVADPSEPIWALARKASEEAAWLMPDFGLWAWENNENDIGPYSQVVDDIIDGEDDGHRYSWSRKRKQLVWRGRSYSASLKYRLACRSVVVAHKLQYIQHHHYLLTRAGPSQNFVEVERDFSDLHATMDYLLASPDLVRTVADNSVRTFRERYLTPAATACYWRELMRGFAAVYTDGGGEGSAVRRGMRFESFLLMGDKVQMKYPG